MATKSLESRFFEKPMLLHIKLTKLSDAPPGFKFPTRESLEPVFWSRKSNLKKSYLSDLWVKDPRTVSSGLNWSEIFRIFGPFSVRSEIFKNWSVLVHDCFTFSPGPCWAWIFQFYSSLVRSNRNFFWSGLVLDQPEVVRGSLVWVRDRFDKFLLWVFLWHFWIFEIGKLIFKNLIFEIFYLVLETFQKFRFFQNSNFPMSHIFH